MGKLQKLIQSYENHTFTSGAQTGNDYKQFEKEYKGVLKDVAKEINAQLVAFNKGHYTFSAFMERDGQFIYISIPDVRVFMKDWRDDVLIRTAQSKTDYSGGPNDFVTILQIQERADQFLTMQNNR